MKNTNIITSATESTRSLIQAAEAARQLADNLNHSAMEAVKAEISEIIENDIAHNLEDFWGHIEELQGGYISSEYLGKFPQKVRNLLTLWFRLYTDAN